MVDKSFEMLTKSEDSSEDTQHMQDKEARRTQAKFNTTSPHIKTNNIQQQQQQKQETTTTTTETT